MTMMQKMQAKKSKKGFTLVELVIVIAILAILAAIAIPVITTTINSAKLSTLQSDCTTLDMVLKEAVNTSLAKITTTTYGSASVTAANAKVSDVLYTNDLSTTIMDTRNIGGKQYQLGWNGESVKVYVGASGSSNAAFLGALIASLEPAGSKGAAIASGSILGSTAS